MCKETGAGVDVEHGEKTGGCFREEECAIVGVEHGGEQGVEGREFLGGEGECLDGGGVDLLDEGVERRVWYGCDVVVVDYKEGVGGFDYF